MLSHLSIPTEKIKADKKIVLTTEKDAVRLEKFKPELTNFPVYVVPIEHEFMFNEAEKFNSIVIDFIKRFYKN